MRTITEENLDALIRPGSSDSINDPTALAALLHPVPSTGAAAPAAGGGAEPLLPAPQGSPRVAQPHPPLQPRPPGAPGGSNSGGRSSPIHILRPGGSLTERDGAPQRTSPPPSSSPFASCTMLADAIAADGVGLAGQPQLAAVPEGPGPEGSGGGAVAGPSGEAAPGSGGPRSSGSGFHFNVAHGQAHAAAALAGWGGSGPGPAPAVAGVVGPAGGAAVGAGQALALHRLPSGGLDAALDEVRLSAQQAAAAPRGGSDGGDGEKGWGLHDLDASCAVGRAGEAAGPGGPACGGHLQVGAAPVCHAQVCSCSTGQL
jgi:hypothetical protein